MKEIYVRDDCRTCAGWGRVQHPSWKEFWEQPNSQALISDNHALEQWFRDRHLLERSSKPIMGQYLEQFPNEEVACPECEGTGKIESWQPPDKIFMHTPATE